MSDFVEPDWNARYVSGDVPWDSGHPSTELRRVVEETDELPRGRLLELGCGTGTNAIYLAQNGFQVTAVDGSSEAISRANVRLDDEQFDRSRSSIGFHCANVVDLPAALSDGEPSHPHVEPFDVLFDRGCYHCVRRADLPGFEAMLHRVTRSGSLFLLFAGNAKETREGRGPPTVSEPELRAELGGTFDFVRLTEFRFDETGDGETGDGETGDGSRPLAWSALLRRK